VGQKLIALFDAHPRVASLRWAGQCCQGGGDAPLGGVDRSEYLREVPYAWSSLTTEEQRDLLASYPIVRALTSSLTWMRQWTRKMSMTPSTSTRGFPIIGVSALFMSCF
jgi:hypothetical protein